jgi:hypothetical protein
LIIARVTNQQRDHSDLLQSQKKNRFRAGNNKGAPFSPVHVLAIEMSK